MIKHIIETDIASLEKIGLSKPDGESIEISKDGTLGIKSEILESLENAKQNITNLGEKLEESMQELSQKTTQVSEDLSEMIQTTREVLTVTIKNIDFLEDEMDSLTDDMFLTKEDIKTTVSDMNARIDQLEGIGDTETIAKEIQVLKEITDSLIEDATDIRNKVLTLEEGFGVYQSHFKNARSYGITGNEEDDNTLEIQELLKTKGNIYFPEGIYNLTKRIDVYGDSMIFCHPKAHFIRKHTTSMFTTYATTETLGYDGEKNIKWHGGILQHNGHTGGSNIFSVFHVDNIEFKNVTFLNCVGAHCLDVVGSNDVKVYNCKFKGYVPVAENSNKEAIQIDLASSASYPIFQVGVPSYDGTPSQNIIIENCEFGASDDCKPYPVAIGQHGQNCIKHRYRNIRIINNSFTGDVEYMYSYCLRPVSWENAVISGNIIEGYKGAFFADILETVYSLTGEKLKSPENPLTYKDEDIYYVGCRNITISENIIRPAESNNVRPGIWFNASGGVINPSGTNSPKHRGISITGNTIYLSHSGVKQYGVDFDTTEGAIIEGNMFIGVGRADSVGIGVQDYCKDFKIGSNLYKGIAKKYEHYTKSNSSEIRKSGETILWSGKAYKKGTTITLSDKISNYSKILVKYEFMGRGYKQMDFSTTSLQSIRETNLADSDSSTSINIFEIRLRKSSDTAIVFEGSKQLAQPSGTIEIDSDKYFVEEIVGIN